MAKWQEQFDRSSKRLRGSYLEFRLMLEETLVATRLLSVDDQDAVQSSFTRTNFSCTSSSSSLSVPLSSPFLVSARIDFQCSNEKSSGW